MKITVHLIRANWASPASFCVYGDGTAWLHTTAVTSDSTLKTDITKLESQVDNIKKLKSVSYKWKSKSLKGDKKTFGLLAQDLEKVYPDMVLTNDSGVKAIYYDELIAVLIEVAKEQQTLIEGLQEKAATIENDCCNNNMKSGSIDNNNDLNLDLNVNQTKLYQNSPNPFSESTHIKYFIAEGIQNSMLNIYDMNGTQLKSIELHQLGKGNVTINGSEFNAGIYMYALIANGQVVDTKRMVLTD